MNFLSLLFFAPSFTYMLFTGDYPGFEVMGFEEDSFISVLILQLHEALNSIK